MQTFRPGATTRIWLYHVIKKNRWAAMYARVSGVKSGGITPDMTIISMGIGKSSSQNIHTGKNMHYCCSIACRKKQLTYRNKIAIYLHWYQKKGIEVPQTQQGDIGAKDIPSWRRISKVYSITITGVSIII
ncbi:DUF3440 domain-containing protein [Escherichia coli]